MEIKTLLLLHSPFLSKTGINFTPKTNQRKSLKLSVDTFLEPAPFLLPSADVDPEDLDFSLNMSGMQVSSSEEEEEPVFAMPHNVTRKHIVYQTELLQLIKQVIILRTYNHL